MDAESPAANGKKSTGIVGTVASPKPETEIRSIEIIVHSFYTEILGREPDPQGFEDYVRRLRDGVPLKSILSAFVLSQEYIAKMEHRFGGNEAVDPEGRFPASYHAPPTEAGKGYLSRRASGFFKRFMSGDLVLDVGYKGYANPHGVTVVPHAIGVDTDYPGYDGLRLPFDDETVDCVFSSHCLEHVADYRTVLRDWLRVLKIGGHMVCIVPSKHLYERKRNPPSLHNQDHKRFYTPASLLAEIEESLEENSYRVRYLEENDKDYDYTIEPPRHAVGAYEIVLALERIAKPNWTLPD